MLTILPYFCWRISGAAGRADLLTHRLRVEHVGEGDGGAFGRERAGVIGPDPLCGARYDRDLVSQSIHCFLTDGARSRPERGPHPALSTILPQMPSRPRA